MNARAPRPVLLALGAGMGALACGVVACGVVACGVVACGPGKDARDATEASRDVIGTADAGSGGTDAYVYGAQRPHVRLGLAEARGMSDAEAHAVTEHLADEFESCAVRLQAAGTLVAGAARVVALADKSGTVEGLNVKVSSGSEQNTLVCLVAPLRATNFPGRVDAAQRGVAIEAAWTRR
jgi:hypothetical protein